MGERGHHSGRVLAYFWRFLKNFGMSIVYNAPRTMHKIRGMEM
jgi:hypothetical protein